MHRKADTVSEIGVRQKLYDDPEVQVRLAALEQFLDWFPGVERWQVESILDHGSQELRDTTS